MTPVGLSHRHIFMRAKNYRIHPLTQRQKRSTKCQCKYLTDALYAFESRGFGGEIGLVLVRKNKKVPRGRHGSPTDDDSGQSSSEGGGLAGQCV